VNAVRNLSWFAPPRVYIIIAIIILILLLFLIGGFGADNGRNPDGTYSVRITKTGPTAVPNPQEKDLTKSDPSDIEYKINVSYAGQADKIIVTDPLPENVDFISAGGPGNPIYDPKTRTVTWNILPGLGGSGSGAGSSDTCNGAYTLTSSKGNFGDPNCEMMAHADPEAKDRLYRELKQTDSQDADYWFFTVIPCESQYNPNAYNGDSTSGAGGYGLFQMNPAGRGNGQYDTGDVIWNTQITNAVTYKNDVIHGWNYWECASDRHN
jgi:hypothetical protein